MTTRALRILVVNWQDRENPQAGGAEVHLHETFRRLVEAGHSVTLLVSGWPGAPSPVELDGMEVHRTGGRYTFSLAGPAYFRRHLAGRKFDVIVEDLNKVPLFTPAWSSTPVVLLVHHLFGATAFQEASVPVAAATWFLERFIPRAYSGLPTVSVSPSTRDDLYGRGLVPSEMEVIPNGVELSQFEPVPFEDRDPDPSLLFLGRIKKYKGVDLLIRATALLRDRGVACRLRIAGSGDHREELESLSHQLNLDSQVEFLGRVSEEEKVHLFQTSWVHLLTSPKEGWGIANIEAAACGTPTIASDAPGLRDSVRDGETGFLVPHGDVPALSDRISRLLSDPDLRRSLGENAVHFAHGFSWDRTATRMEEVLLRAVGPRVAPPAVLP